MQMTSRCPICEAMDLVDISEQLIRETDVILHENEDYKHVIRGRINLLVHTKPNVDAEHKLPSSYLFGNLAVA